MTKNYKRYSFITRSTGNPARIRGAETRQQAREIKAANGFRLAIFDNVTGQVVR
jgi:hypothetical protein